MSEKHIEDNLENSKETIDPNDENLGATGQILLGELEQIGGILTANPEAQAQGEFNVEVGKLRKEVSENLIESESEEE